MIAIDHVLACLLLFAYPVWDVLETRQLKRSTSPRRKIACFQRITVVLWSTALLAFSALRTSVFYTWPIVHESVWQRNIRASFVWGLIIAWIAFNLLRSFRRRNIRLRETTVTALKRLEFFLPSTNDERRWFAIISITAGICEEVLYRGFLIRYFCAGPWHVGLTLAVVVSCAAFGLAHTYQGLGRIISTGCLGAIMAIIFFITGSLWLPILLHAFIDLNMLLLLRRGSLGPLAGVQ